MMRLFYIRHGQSENNALWSETGTDSGRNEDPKLTETGHEQARLLAAFILVKDNQARTDGKNGEPKRDFFCFTHLYTSLMVRSVGTATYLSRALGLPLVGWPEIHECGGIYLDGEKLYDANHLTVLDEPELHQFASRFGNPDILLSEVNLRG